MVRALVCFVFVAAVAAGFALTASGTPAARCQPTVSDTPGPFQQGGVNAPRRAKIGTGHILQGRVLAPDCSPVARALVVLWQAGPNGYRPKGRGSVLTDRAGRFRFEGPVPASYGGGRISTSPSSIPRTRSSRAGTSCAGTRRPDASGSSSRRCSSLRRPATRARRRRRSPAAGLPPTPRRLPLRARSRAGPR